MVGDFFISRLDFATIRHFRKRLTLKEKGNLDGQLREGLWSSYINALCFLDIDPSHPSADNYQHVFYLYVFFQFVYFM